MSETSIILFYKYHPLSSDREITEIYRHALEGLCQSLELKGRILVAASESEGINGTLAGTKTNVEAFTHALLGPDHCSSLQLQPPHQSQSILHSFWQQCSEFCQIANLKPLTMPSPEDFKWSTSEKEPSELFPDLNIKLVGELIGTGGILAQIPVEETSQGYLSPTEWHQALHDRNPDDSILIDCRNTKECQIGHFQESLDPGTNTFSQFPHWVRQNQESIRDKTVFMYCTGGIRCEKASAYIRRVVGEVKEVHHLKGGIHKYLEAFPNQNQDSLWRGKNFVFDGRTSQDVRRSNHDGTTDSSGLTNDIETIVGKCLYCKKPFDSFRPENVCTVCREPTLVCDNCKPSEIHCKAHFHLRHCYFHNLTPYSKIELGNQLQELERHLAEIAIGRKFKQKRKTLQKQCEKTRAYLHNENCLLSAAPQSSIAPTIVCRNCGDVDCTGSCWGFHGLKRKERLEAEETRRREQSHPKPRAERRSAGERASKQSKRQQLEREIQQQGLRGVTSSVYHDLLTGLRIPCPYLRVIQTNVKGKWCGKTVLDVVAQEFVDVQNDLENILRHGLLRVNHTIVSRENNVLLKNMDTIERLVHWHEPPVLVPSSISVQRICLPDAVIQEHKLDQDSAVIVCDKPSTVPVHPTGPYLANALTVIVEGQEGCDKSLKPCHRLDRATSGLTILAQDSKVSKLIQGTLMEQKCVRKLYIAEVEGKFPTEVLNDEVHLAGFGAVTVLDDVGTIEVCAPIEVVDPSSGIRRVSLTTGRKCTSRFRLVDYNDKEGTSLIICHPITGRGHQLRVHLKALGHPIIGDILYGGKNQAVTTVPNEAIVTGIQKSLRLKVEGSSSNYNIPLQDVRSVELSCRSCNDGERGIQASFSDAQLLRGGHVINLHAFRYEIVFRRPKDANEVLGTLLMEVDLPSWGKTRVDSRELSWLI